MRSLWQRVHGEHPTRARSARVTQSHSCQPGLRGTKNFFFFFSPFCTNPASSHPRHPLPSRRQQCAMPAGAWPPAPRTGGESWSPRQPEKSASKFLPALPPRKGRARGVAVRTVFVPRCKKTRRLCLSENPHATLRALRCSFWAANTSLEPKPCYSLFPIHLCPPTSPETSTGSTQNNPPARSRPPRDPHSCAAPGTPGG